MVDTPQAPQVTPPTAVPPAPKMDASGSAGGPYAIYIPVKVDNPDALGTVTIAGRTIPYTAWYYAEKAGITTIKGVLPEGISSGDVVVEVGAVKYTGLLNKKK